MNPFIRINVDARAPIFIHLDPDNFGQVFANMNSFDQAQVLKAIAEHIKPFQLQWDYIAIEMEKPEFAGTANTWRDFITSIGAA